MNLLIHIEINQLHKLHFEKEIVKWTKTSLPEITALDFDNHSDSFIIDSALKLAKDAEKIMVIIDIEAADMEPGGAIKFLNGLLRLKKMNVIIVLNGEHAVINKMIPVFPNHYKYVALDAQKEVIRNFFNS